jgi:hypothetical protein
MATPERIESICVEVEELISTLNLTLQEIEAESTMGAHDEELEAAGAHPSLASINDTKSIHFAPQNDSQKHTFSRLLTDELMLRGLEVTGSIEERCETL